MSTNGQELGIMAMAARAAERIASLSGSKQAYLRRVMSTVSPTINDLQDSTINEHKDRDQGTGSKGCLSWQPLESAPKDGEPLDLWVLYTECRKNSDTGITFGRIEHDARWYDDGKGEAWFSSGRLLLDFQGEDLDTGGMIRIRPTHWRRVPKTGPNGEKDGALVR